MRTRQSQSFAARSTCRFSGTDGRATPPAQTRVSEMGALLFLRAPMNVDRHFGFGQNAADRRVRERPVLDRLFHHGALCIAAERQRQGRSEEHTSELQSLMRNSYTDLCLNKKKTDTTSTIESAHIVINIIHDKDIPI